MNNISKETPTVGFPFARDSKGFQIPASQAKSGEKYLCPNCPCKMIHKISSRGTHFFAKAVREIHTNPNCQNIEKTGKCHSFSESNSPEELIHNILHIPLSRTNPPKNAEHSVPIHKENIENIPVPKSIAFTSLKQICEYGIAWENPFVQYGKYCTSDFYIHFKWMPQFFNTTNFKLGARILEVGFYRYDDSSKSLIFHAFIRSNKGEPYPYNFHVCFLIRFRNTEAYRKNLKRFYIPYLVENTGKTLHRSSKALIASPNWEHLDRLDCILHCNSKEEHKCKNCKGMYRTDYVCDKQLYPIPFKNK